VGIYSNQNINRFNIVTPNIQMSAIQSSSQQLEATLTGDNCIAECQAFDGKKNIFTAVYISVNQKFVDIIFLLHRQLLAYSHGGAALLNTDYDKIPLISGGDFNVPVSVLPILKINGDFNVNFASDDSTPLINFLYIKFYL